MGTTAAAQPPVLPAREALRGQVVLAGSAAEPVPEIRVAAHEATFLHFDAPIERASVEVEGRPVRFKWVEVADSLIGLEPSVDLGAEEKLLVRVRYKDGASPSTVTLALVTRAAVVDKEVAVVRRARSREALEARVAELESEQAALQARCEQGALANLAFAGLLDPRVELSRFNGSTLPGDRGGLKPGAGEGYRATRWAMVVLQLHNLPGQAPWSPTLARLTSKAGSSVQVRSVHMEKPRLMPGEDSRVVVVMDPPRGSDNSFQLELMDASGAVHRFGVNL
jgi:uncharacterized protein (TIGR02268 family)